MKGESQPFYCCGLGDWRCNEKLMALTLTLMVSMEKFQAHVDCVTENHVHNKNSFLISILVDLIF